MMTADDCKQRADKCAAAHYTSDLDAQRIWHQLSDLWALWSEQCGQFDPKNNETQVAARPRIIEPATPRVAKGLKTADRLRLGLKLTDEIPPTAIPNHCARISSDPENP